MVLTELLLPESGCHIGPAVETLKSLLPLGSKSGFFYCPFSLQAASYLLENS